MSRRNATVIGMNLIWLSFMDDGTNGMGDGGADGGPAPAPICC